jgi:MFS family permease
MIFQFAGFKSASGAILATAGLGIINVIFTFVAVLLMDKAGRRPLLLGGLIGMIIALALLGFVFTLRVSPLIGKFAVGSLALYIASFAMGLGPVFWLMIAEIFPVKIRGLAMGVCSLSNWVANLIVALFFLTLTDTLGKPGTFWLFCAISIIAWVFIFKLVPETKGKSLEEIEAHWRMGKHPRELSG